MTLTPLLTLTAVLGGLLVGAALWRITWALCAEEGDSQ